MTLPSNPWGAAAAVLVLPSTLAAVAGGDENEGSSAKGQNAECRPLEKLDRAGRIRWVYKVAAWASDRVETQVSLSLVLNEHCGGFPLQAWAGSASGFGRLVKGRCLLRI